MSRSASYRKISVASFLVFVQNTAKKRELCFSKVVDKNSFDKIIRRTKLTKLWLGDETVLSDKVEDRKNRNQTTFHELKTILVRK